MQLDRTRVVVRERTQLELLDLSLRVVAQNIGPLVVALALGVLPFALLNEFFLRQAPIRMSEVMPSDEAAQADAAGEGLAYALVLAIVTIIEVPLATMFVTHYLGQYMFAARPRWSRLWADAAGALPQLLVFRGFPIAIAAVALFLPPPSRGAAVVFLGLPALLLGFAAPYANEIILLERNSWKDVFRRWTDFHRNTNGLLIQRSMAVGASITALTISLWAGLVITRDMLLDTREHDSMSELLGLGVEAPIAFWIAAGVAATVRYFSYIDLRIRREGWELELAMRAEAQKLEERLS